MKTSRNKEEQKMGGQVFDNNKELCQGKQPGGGL